MVKRITVSISDELAEKIEAVEHGLSKEFSLSAIFQNALEESLENIQRRDAIAKDGVKFGEDYFKSLSRDEQRKAKSMIDSWPRKYPEEVIEIFVKAGLITSDTLEKHLDVLKYWKSVHERFEQIKGFGDADAWDYWIGSPVFHEGVEIWESGISETGIHETHTVNITLADGTTEQGEIRTCNRSTADIRYSKAKELWRHGFIKGMKMAIRAMKEGKNEND